MRPISHSLQTICNLTFVAVFAALAVMAVLIVSAGAPGSGGAAVAAEATIPLGTKTISLVSVSGEKLKIGTVTLKPADGANADQRTIDVKLDVADFTDQFLSMRPFRCLPDKKQMWCHLAYPYALENKITSNDLTDLEYQLLFIFRSPDSYGIDAWNGLYFKLSRGEDRKISGNAHEVDLNILAVPPDDPTLRPISASDLTAIEPDTHRFARVEIE